MCVLWFCPNRQSNIVAPLDEGVRPNQEYSSLSMRSPTARVGGIDFVLVNLAPERAGLAPSMRSDAIRSGASEVEWTLEEERKRREEGKSLTHTGRFKGRVTTLRAQSRKADPPFPTAARTHVGPPPSMWWERPPFTSTWTQTSLEGETRGHNFAWLCFCGPWGLCQISVSR